ncbi:hypothetical protein O4H50_05910 [Vibrio diazotrophicus]|uniref:hypothetical protein n=1 Tax=Vibrio diazotrophicus TaxID=685 RepID=UPI0022AF0E04|nr:hypothetical protein [Vibrio diazotrophicus]MCZ4371319.1 hypothetical protein [Vibrio diazotrophicus]
MVKLNLELRHRAKPNESYDEKHTRFLESIADLGTPWNLEGLMPLPDIGSELVISVSLDKILGAGVKGNITYKYRSEKYLEDNAQFDDHIQIDFNEGKISLNEIIRILKSYIPAFDCYRATLRNWNITKSDWAKIVEESNNTGKDVNGRDGVYRINPINYFDRELCLRAFGLSPEQITQRLEGKVESVSLLHDGVLLIYSTLPVEQGNFDNIDEEVKRLLQ